MQVGGPADYFAEIHTKGELGHAYQFAQEKQLPIVVLGKGTNMIFPDEGIRGLVVKIKNEKFKIENNYVNVSAGMILGKLIYECQKNGLNGLNPWLGIPGTVGASVAGNVGIPGHELGSLVQEVEIFDGQELRTLNREQCEFRYRGSRIRDEGWLVWSVKLKIANESPLDNKEWFQERIAKQPRGFCCGSFFKNPDPVNGIFAGKLIEECGMKGKRIGGAVVSDQHANFLMNMGNATAKDVINLAKSVKEEVLEKKGVILQNEVLVYSQEGGLVNL